MTEQQFAKELRKWWSFNDRQIHTHSWHSREDFIERKLPELLVSVARAAVAQERKCALPCACHRNPQPGDCQEAARVSLASRKGEPQ